ncbi:MAG: elongation factor Ts [Deltaproteobacteria bacterium RBG_16_54_11]|jgi:elongation factor Ts|nr:MAG: elongation factor Ts [Deltaproteobacteria bacterium RBG_16_54_11]
MEISPGAIKELRQRTGVGVMDCKKALLECAGNINEAIDCLRKKGLAKAAKRAGRETAEGLIASYIHPGGKIGVLVDIDCETDFVARTEDFRNLAKEIAMHIAAMNPIAISREDVPPEVIEKEKEILRAEAATSGKPEKVVDKIVEGRLEKFFAEQCVLEQAYIKNPDITVKDFISNTIAKLGENITVRRFTRYQLGEILGEDDG